MSHRPDFITHRFRLGFTSPSLHAPRLHRLLMPCPFEPHFFQLSCSFGPSPHTRGYYGLG
jgi:hypothetical protein